MLGMEDKVVLVTGGNRGIGAGIVAHLEDCGAKVAYTYRSGTGPRGALALKADVTDASAMESVAETVEKDLGPIYGVVANAGVNKDAFFHKLDAEKWQAVIDTNLTGIFNTIRPILPLLYDRQEGAIVFVSSVVGEQGNLGQSNYAATKSAMFGLAKTLALEGARSQVRVNVIAPGFTATDMLTGVREEVQQKILQTIPLGRFATIEEIAWGVTYLLSPVTGGYVTGTTLSINGGRHT